MATFSKSFDTVFGDRRIVVGEVTMSSSYTTGGEGLSNLGLNRVDGIVLLGEATGGYDVDYDHSTGTFKAWYYNYPAAAAGAAVEVPAGTNLSSVKLKVLAVGK
ncbi:MAG: hypothetical protein QXQ02_03710 [Halobacteria archaeon]